jgi:hypothetical protein
LPRIGGGTALLGAQAVDFVGAISSQHSAISPAFPRAPVDAHADLRD